MVQCVDKNGLAPVHLATYIGNEGVIEAWLNEMQRLGFCANSENDSKAPPLVFAVAASSKATVVRLLAAGADPACVDIDGCSALHKAAAQNDCSIVEVLTEAMRHKGISVDTKNKNGQTALFMASAKSSTESVENLLQTGAYVGHVDNMGASALFNAALYGRLNVLKLLIPAARRQGVSLDIEDSDGTTPFLIAAEKADASVVELLLQEGASPTHVDRNKRSALHYAALNREIQGHYTSDRGHASERG